MRLLALLVVAALWGAPALAETKDGPDGFGAIKFGMTKDEAWAAIGGKGEWTEDDELNYALDPIGALGSHDIAVILRFMDGKASLLNATLLRNEEWSRGCIIYLHTVILQVTDRYGTRPVRLESRPIGPLNQTVDHYLFIYENGYSINVVFTQHYYDNENENLSCSIDLTYMPVYLYDDNLPF